MPDYSDKPRVDPYNPDTRYVEAPPREGTGSLWFILGGVVVALVIIFAIVYGGSDGTSVAPADGTAPSVTIENGTAAPMAPADNSATPAPAAPPADNSTAPAAPAPSGG
jgi:hypothetical protein